MFDFNAVLRNIDITLSDYQLEQFENYYKFLLEYNEKVNLTAITDEMEVYIKHFYDSILVSKAIDFNSVESICDVGSGAGFPSIPLKILYPRLKVTIVDSLEKRLVFIKELANLLKLEDISVIHSRAEDFKEGGCSFDVVTARAVARENIIEELCIPLSKVGGYFISMKGCNYQEELNETKAYQILGARIESVNEYELPLIKEGNKRVIIVIKHEKETNKKYPRNWSQIKNKPL